MNKPLVFDEDYTVFIFPSSSFYLILNAYCLAYTIVQGMRPSSQIMKKPGVQNNIRLVRVNIHWPDIIKTLIIGSLFCFFLLVSPTQVVFYSVIIRHDYNQWCPNVILEVSIYFNQQYTMMSSKNRFSNPRWTE